MFFDFFPDLLQDMCMSCGAYGIDDEGRLISCVQCGQSYHPYCVEVKVDMTSILIGLLLDMICMYFHFPCLQILSVFYSRFFYPKRQI